MSVTVETRVNGFKVLDASYCNTLKKFIFIIFWKKVYAQLYLQYH